jgi:uracil phosphoribosyltransferase
MSALPSNVRVSAHPCLLAKLGQLRSRAAGAKDVKTLVHDISLIVGCEALAGCLRAVPSIQVSQPYPLTMSPLTRWTCRMSLPLDLSMLPR